MATPCDIALADEIVAAINGRFDGVTAERTWLPDWDQKIELKGLRVCVQPGTTPSAELVEREKLWEIWPIDVGFARRLQEHTREEIDGLICLVDQVRELLQLSQWKDGEGRIYESIGYEFLARFDPTLLDRQVVDGNVTYAGSFLSLVRFDFRRFD
ncbi:MAG: hypothetical protein WBC44_03740 [Planctomycetaceae bacterium]